MRLYVTFQTVCHRAKKRARPVRGRTLKKPVPISSHQVHQERIRNPFFLIRVTLIFIQASRVKIILCYGAEGRPAPPLRGSRYKKQRWPYIKLKKIYFGLSLQ